MRFQSSFGVGRAFLRHSFPRLSNFFLSMIGFTELSFACKGQGMLQQKLPQSSFIHNVVDEAAFEALVLEMAAYDEQREKIIKQSRDIQKNAKQAIFSLHRGDPERAGKQLSECRAISERISGILGENPDLKYGSFSSSMEEYAEALVFKAFLEEGRLLSPAEVGVTREEYLGGVLDFCGELNRYCVAKATARDIEEVKRCRDLVETLMGLFLQFDFRNGSLRKKFDALKYTLRKMENTMYELSLTSSGVGKSRAVEDGAESRDEEGEV
mmetsp:Transcript_18369/g.43929  ORF Transcript_18369/g.43929 Transcript_18369/m.43929 type:complete len:269 (+) Transcript_18369:80-886(+)